MATHPDLCRARPRRRRRPRPASLAAFLDGFSIEVMPRTAAKVADFRAILPAGTRVYVAHIDGTDVADMVATVPPPHRRRLRGDAARPRPRHREPRRARPTGSASMPTPAAHEALAIAGGIDRAARPLPDTMAMLETGLFDARGFTRLHVAGHPEGNRDIDPDGGEDVVMAALRAKADFAARHRRRDGDRHPVRLRGRARSSPGPTGCAPNGIDLPVHIGVAGPAKLQTMIKFAMACGVGPSLRVLQRRASDLTNLILPFEPTEILAALAAAQGRAPGLRRRGRALLPARRHRGHHRLRRSRDGRARPRAGMIRFALLFDLDGTLVDTDHLHHAAFAAILAEQGRALSFAEYRDRIMGRPNGEIMDWLMPDAPDHHAALADRKEAAYRDRARGDASSRSPASMRCSTGPRRPAPASRVVTNAPRLNAEAVLTAAGLAHRLSTRGDRRGMRAAEARSPALPRSDAPARRHPLAQRRLRGQPLGPARGPRRRRPRVRRLDRAHPRGAVAGRRASGHTRLHRPRALGRPRTP